MAFLHPPSRAYIDPWTGEFFGEGGVEKDMRLVPYPTAWVGSGSGEAIAPAPDSISGDKAKENGMIGGGVIMSKLGNETAKYVVALLRSSHSTGSIILAL